MDLGVTMLGHVTKDIFQSATPNTSAAFKVSGDAKVGCGSIYAPGATAGKLEFSFDGGATWVGHATALTTPAAGFFGWTNAYITYPLARFVATAGTATSCRVFTPE